METECEHDEFEGHSASTRGGADGALRLHYGYTPEQIAAANQPAPETTDQTEGSAV